MIYEEIEALTTVLRDSPVLTELEVRNGATVVRLRRTLPTANIPAPLTVPVTTGSTASGAVGLGEASPAESSTAIAVAADAESPLPTRITAALVGVFHPSRTTPVALGQTAKAGQILGQIEAMRLMNDVTATVAGRVVGVLVQDGQPVQYGQPLFEIVAD